MSDNNLIREYSLLIYKGKTALVFPNPVLILLGVICIEFVLLSNTDKTVYIDTSLLSFIDFSIKIN